MTLLITVAIIGCLGYTGLELVRILSRHPKVETKFLTVRNSEESGLDDFFRFFPSLRNVKITTIDKASFENCSVVFFATPHGVAMKYAQSIISKGIRVIDLSADFRLTNQEDYKKWYGMEHLSPTLLKDAVYGLPEINREKILNAKLIAMPGCYPTSVTLGLLPLIEENLIHTDSIIADCKSGVSGAGKALKKTSLYGEVSESFKAYGLEGHRHWPEIYQELSKICKSYNTDSSEKLNISFVPHLLPMFRGIFTTLHLKIKKECLDYNFYDIFVKRFSNERFVKVLKDESPETRFVKGSNFIHLSVYKSRINNNHNSNILTVLVAEDNLVKGAAGQATQVMNIMFNVDESTGLESHSWTP